MSEQTGNNDKNQDLEKVQDTIGAGRADQDANADRGGTTDLDSTIRRGHSTGTGSGLSSKTSVTGSDLDGQVKDQ
jgi:hypothetical protein